MENRQAIDYLASFLGKRLRIYTTDTRMFIGEFKCTDNECNIILSQTYEYRQPNQKAVQGAALDAANQSTRANLKVDMTSRFLGLVVLPGKHITKIEAEEQ